MFKINLNSFTFNEIVILFMKIFLVKKGTVRYCFSKKVTKFAALQS